MRRFRRKSRYLKVWGKKAVTTLMTGLLMAALANGPALANPSGGQVRAGSVNISTVGPNSLHIEQMTQKAIIDWQSFGINPGEAVRFLQPNQLSVILNRVVGQDPSRILGELTANGNVWLINPNGVLFGPGSTVNVGGLVASTLNISNEDFLSGNYRFQQDMSKPLASVVNQGSITITDGGYAVLMAPLVSNEGLIVANLGQVNLLAGESATLNFDGRNLVSYNIGKVEGEAGTVLLSRDAVSGLLANVITSPTLTEAGGMVENADGTISLVGASGTAITEGIISTNGAEGQKAGKVVVDSGRLTVVGPEAVVEASGSGKNSDGGTVLALSEGMLYTASGSQLKARGSEEGGDGGFVETSGKNFIINSIADVGAAAGKAGEWLIDPEFLTIIEGPANSGGMDGDTPPDGFLADPAGTTQGKGGQVNTISTGFLESLSKEQVGTVTLQADNQITISNLSSDLLAFQDGVSVKFETITGDLLFVDRSDKVVVGGTGSLTLDIGRDIYLGVLESTGTGKIDIEYGTGGAGKIYADSATTRVIGNDLVFRNTSTDLGVYDDPDDTTMEALRIAGAGTISPNRIELNVGSGRVVDLITANNVNLDITSAGVLTSGDFRTAGTNIDINKTGALSIQGFTAKETNITAGVITGNGTTNTVDLTADKAVIKGTTVGNNNNNRLETSVKQLEVESTGTGNIRLGTDDSALKDLTIRSNNSLVAVNSNGVAPSNIVATTGTTTTISNFNKPGVNFHFYEKNATRQAEIGNITANSVDLNFAGSILNQTDNTTNVINASTVTLTTRNAEAFIGADGAPIRVANNANVAVSVNNGVVDLASPARTLKHDATGLLTATDSSGSFSSVAFTNTGTNDVVVGELGTGTAALKDVSITAQGSIVDSDADGDATIDIYADKVRLTSIGGSVGTSANAIETSAKELSGSSSTGVHLANNKALDTFEIETNSASSTISATNGIVSITSGGVLTAGGVTAGTNVNTAGTTSNTVTVNVTRHDASGITVSDVKIGDSGASTLNITATAGNIVSGSGTTDITAQNTVINLTALDGNVGTTTDKITIALSGSDNTVSADAKSDVGLDITGTAPTELSVAHDDGAVDVDVVGGGEVTRTGDALTVKGATGLTTIDYTNRTATNTTLADGSIATNNHSNINITTKGNITGAVGAADIVAGNKTVSIVTEGNFTASASSTGTGSLSLESVGGNATVTNNGNLTLKGGAPAGTASVEGDLVVHNGKGASVASETLQLDSLSVGGNATLNNDGTITGSGTAPNLTANSLNVVTTAQNTSLDLDTSVDSITINDTVGTSNSNGSFTIDNDKALGSVTIDSRGTDKIEITTPGDPTEKLSYGDNGSDDSILTASNPDIGNLTITEHQNSIEAGVVNLESTSQTTLQTDAINNTGTITMTADADARIITGNLTLETKGSDSGALIDVKTQVRQTLDITSAKGTIDFHDSGNPIDIVIDTQDGRRVQGSWGEETDDAKRKTLSYNGDNSIGSEAQDLFNIVNPNSSNTTNVTFETGKGDIVIGQADLGNGGDMGTGPGGNLTLIASENDPSGHKGRILDNGESDTVDIISRNATLIAVGNIGTSDDPIETDVPETLEARSETGGVYLDSKQAIVDHVIIDVKGKDYHVGFDGGKAVEYTAGTGPSNTSKIEFTGADDLKGTNLTLIERSTDSNHVVDIATDITNDTNNFIRIIAGAGITNTTDKTLTSGFVDLVSAGHIGTATHAIKTDTNDLSIDSRGRDKNVYVDNQGDLDRVVLNVDHSDTGAQAHVAWRDEESSNSADRSTWDKVGFSVINTLVSSAASVTNDGTTTTTTHVNDAQVYITNGLVKTDGEFNVVPNPDRDFNRFDGYVGTTGGNLRVGDYTAQDLITPSTGPTGNSAPYLELTAKTKSDNAASGSIFNGGGTIDMAGGTVSLVADKGIGAGTGSDDGAVEVKTATGSGVNTVNAYTGQGNINVSGVGPDGHIVFNEVYAGADLSAVISPFYKSTGVFNGGGVGADGIGHDASGAAAGNVTLTSGGSMDVVDIVAGTTKKSDGNITLTAANDVRIGRLQADQDTVKVTVTGDGHIREIDSNSTGKVFANEFVADINGIGNIGSGAAGSSPLDLVVNTVTATTDDGGIYLRNIGQVEWKNVQSNQTSTSSTEDIYLVSEGAAFVKNVVGGGESDVLIVTRSGSDMLVGEVTAEDNTVTLVSTDRIRSDLGGKVTAKDVLLLATSHIGVAAKTTDPTHDVNGKPIMEIAPLQLNANTVAGRSNTGSIYLDQVAAGGDLTVGSVTDTVLGGPRNADGLTAKNSLPDVAANQDIHVDVKDGALNVTRTIDAGRNVALRTAGTDNGIIIGTGTSDATTVVKAGTTVSLEATGAVTDNNAAGTAAVEATNIVVDAGSLTRAVGTGQFEVNAETMAVKTTGNTFVKDLTGNLTIGQLDTILTPSNTITGSTTTNGDICYEVVEGTLTVSNVVTAAGTGKTVGLKAHNNVNINAAVTATDKISILSTDGALTGNQTLTTTAAGTVGDNNGVVVKTKAAIGETNGPLTIDTHQFAAWSQEGGVNVKDLNGDLNIAKLTLDVCGAGAEEISGVQGAVGRNIKIDADGGDLILTEVVKGHNGDAGTIALRAEGNIDLNNADRGVVARDKISLEAVNGGLLQTDPNTTGPALKTADTGEIVIRANNSIAASSGGSLKIATGKLAAESKTGSVSIIDVDGDLTVGTGTLETGPAGDRTVTGVKAGSAPTATTGDVCLEVEAGTLTITQAVSAANGKVAVAAQGDITVANTGSITARDKISISSVDGGLYGQGLLSTTAATTPDHATDPAQRGGIVISTKDSIGTSVNNAVQIRTDKFAAQSTHGNVFVDAVNSPTLTVTEITTEHCDATNTTVTGVTSAPEGTISLNVVNGALTLDRRVGSNVSDQESDFVALRANDSININGGSLGGVVANDKISIESVTGSLTGTLSSGPTLVTKDAGGEIVILTSGAIQNSDGSKLEVSTDNLAAESKTASVKIKDVSSDGVTVKSLQLASGTWVNGVKAATDIDLEATNTVRVEANVQSTHSTDGDVIVTAGNQILDTIQASGAIIGTNVVLDAVNGIGEFGNRVEVNATNFAAKTTTGDIRVQDIAGGMTVAENVAGTSTSGVTAPGLIDLSVTGGPNSHLNVSADISSTTGNVALTATGNVTLGDAAGSSYGVVTAGDNITVSAGGDIIDGNGDQPNLIARGGEDPGAIAEGTVSLTSTGGSIGAAANAIEIQAGKLGATATVGSVNVTDTTGNLEVTGVTAGTDVRISVTDSTVGAPGNLDITDQIVSTGSGLVHLTAVGDIEDSVSGAAVSTGGNLVLQANTLSSTSTGGAFEIATAGLAGSITSGNVTIKDLTDSLTIVNDAGVDGLTAGNGDICLEVVQQDLLINEEITSTNKDVAIKAGQNIVVNADVTAEDKISAHAVAGNITGTAGRLVTELTGNDGEVILQAGGSIGTNPTTGALRVSTDKLAAIAGGDVYLQAEAFNLTTPVDRNLTVTQLDSFNCGETGDPKVTGILSGAGKEISVNVVHGGLILDERVGSDVNGQESSLVALQARNNITLNNATHNGVVARDKISVESTLGGLLGTVTGNPSLASLRTTNDGGEIVISTHQSINSGPDAPLEIATDRLAARSTTGSISIIDKTGDLTVASIDLASGTTVTGVTAGDDGDSSTSENVCLEVALGELTITQAVSAANGRVAVAAHGDITINADGTGTPANAGAIEARDKISIYSEEGGLVRSGTAANQGALTTTAATGGQIVIDTFKSIGAEGQAVRVNTDELAARSRSHVIGEGNVIIDAVQNKMLTITEITAEHCEDDFNADPVTGIQSGTGTGNKVLINVTGGGLTLDEGINNGTGRADTVGLKASGDIVQNDNKIAAQDKISIESGGALSSSITAGTASLETTNANSRIVIKTAGTIDVDVATEQLAAYSTGGSVNVEDLAGSLRVTELALEHNGGPVTGVVAGGAASTATVKTALNLDVDRQVMAANLVDLAATSGNVSNNINTVGENIQVTSGTGLVRVTAGGQILDTVDNDSTSGPESPDTGAIIGTNVVLRAGAGIGDTTHAVEVDAINFAAHTTSGGIRVQDVNESMIVGSVDGLSGVVADAGNICLDVLEGVLSINELVTATDGNVGLSALGNITVGANVTAKDKISVYSHNGSLSGAATLAVTNTASGETVIKTYGSIGSTSVPLTVTTPFLAAESTNGNVYLKSTGSVTVADLDLAICDLPAGVDASVSGIKAGGANSQVGMAVVGDLTIGRTTGDTVAPTISANSLVSLEVGGNVTDNNGVGNAAVVTSGDVVITSTNGAISGSGTNTPFEIAAGGLAASAKNDISIKDLAGGLEVKSVRPLLTNTTADVVGVTSEDGNICLEADDGVLTVTSAVTANETDANKGKVSLHGGTGVVINNTVTADKKISVLSGGTITGSGTLTTNNDTVVNGGGVVLVSTGNIGAAGANALDVSTNRLAARSTNGSVYIDSAKALTIADLVLEVCDASGVNTQVTGVTANGQVGIKTVGDLTIGEGDPVDGRVVSVTSTNSTNNTVSLEATGNIVDNNGAGNAAVITPGDVVIVATGGAINGGTGPFELEASGLAAQAQESISIKDLDDDLELKSVTPLIGGGAPIAGVTSTDGNICIEAADGVLTVAQAVNANDAGTKTAGVGKVALNGKDGIVLNAAVSADEKISLYSSEGGLGGSNRTLTTLAATDVDASTIGEVVIKTKDDIGALGTPNTPIIVTTDLLAAESGGSVYIQSTRDVTIADLVLEVCGLADSPVTGVKANGQVGLDVNGNLTIGRDSGDASAPAIVANNTVSLEATGNIVDNNGDDRAAVVTDGTLVVQSDNGSINLEVEAKTLAAEADNGSISVKDLDTKNDGLTIGTGTTLLGDDDITGVTALGDICVQTTNGVLQVSESVISQTGNVALHATSGNVVIGDGTGAVEVVQASGTNKNISIVAGGEIIANNGVDVTGNPNISIIGPNVALRSGTGIGNLGSSTVIGVNADVLAADGGTGQVHLFDPNGVIIGKVGLIGCDLTGDVTGISAEGPITVDVAMGNLNIHENIEGGDTIGLRSRGGDLVIGNDDGDVVKTTGTGANGTVSLEATGKVEDNNGANTAAVITPGTLVIIADTLIGDGNMDSGNPGGPVQPDNAFEIKTGGLAIDIESGDVAVVSLDGDLTITKGRTVLSTMLNPTETVTGVTTPADFYLDVTNGELRVDEDITVGTGDIALAAQSTIILGSTDGTTPRGVIKVNTPDTTLGLESTVSVESRTGAVLDGHRDKDAPDALVNIDNKGGNVVIFSATGIGGTEPDTAGGLEGEIEVDTKYFAGDGGTGDIKLRDLDTGSIPDGLDLSKNLITLIDEKSLTSIKADYDIYLTVDHSAIDVNANIVAGGDVALRTQTGDINIGAQIVAGDKSATTGKVGTVNLTTNEGSITNTNPDTTTAIVAKGNGTTSGGDIVLIAHGSIGAGDAITTDTGRIAAVSKTGSISIVEHDTITQDGLTVDKIPTLQDVGTEIDGIEAALDVCVDVLPVAGGDLVISRDITSNTKNVGLQSQGGDIRIQSGAVVSTTVSTTAVANQVSMVAHGQITSANDPATTSSILSENVVMVAGSGIGNASAIGIEAVNFAASGGTGDVNIVDRDGKGLTIAKLDVDVCHPIVPVTTVTGITTGGSVKVDVTGGDLNVNEDITATNGGVALRTQDGDIIIGDDDTATGSNADVIKAGGKVSLEAFDKDGDGNGGNVVDNNGAGNAAVVTPGNVVIVAEKAGGTNNKPFEVEAGGIAAKTTETLKVKDLTGNLKTVNDTTTFGNSRVDGVTSTEGDVCLEVVQGDLDIAEQITSLTGDVRVRANGNVTLSGTDSISAKNTLVVSSATGEIRDTNSGDFVGDTVVLVAAKGIGNTGEVSLRANKLAANGGTGDVNVIDMTGDLEIGKYVGALICDGPVANVTGLSGGGRIIVEVPNGSLTFTEGVNTNPGDPTAKSVTLKTKDEIDLKGHPIVAQDKISIESKDGGLIGTTKDGTPDLRTTNTGGNGQVVIKTKDDINVEVATDKLAAQSTGGSVTIKDLTGNLIVTELELEKGGGKVDGVRAEDGVCLEVVEGALEIAEGISSSNGNVKIRANGDVNVTASDDISAKDQLVMSSANGQLVNNGSGDLVGDTVVLVAATGIGNTRDFTLRANTLAANGGTGSVNVVDRDGGLVIGSFTGALICDGPTETITGVTGGGNIGIEVPDGPLVIDAPVTGGGTVAIKTGGDIESNAPVKGGDKISVETGGSIKDGSGNKDPNFEAPEIVIKAGGDIGTKDNNIEINSDKVAATSTGGGVYLTETDGDLNVGTIELEKDGGTVSGVTGKTKVELDVPKGTVTYDNDNPIKAGDAIYIRTRDTLILDGILEAGNRICIDVTNGDILDNNEGTDIRTKDVVMRASGSIGTPENHIDLDVDRVAAEAIRGSVNITEKNGLTITSMEMCNGGGTIPGIKAGTDVNVKVIEGDLTVGYVEGGGNVTLEVDNGDIYDGNGPDLNIKAGGDVELLAPKGYVAPDGDELEILSGTGRIVILEITGYRMPPVSIALAPHLFPPGLFAQDNVAMGLNSFYLDVLYGYLTPEEIALIIEELDRYNYLEDEDFLLEKHPHHKGRKRDEDKDKEQGQ